MSKEIIKVLLGRLFGSKKILWRHSSCKMKAVALTFDDGPHPIFTPLVLDQLLVMGVKATFFLVGERVEKYPEVVQRIIDEGHEVGCHTYSHLRFSDHTSSEIEHDLSQSDKALCKFSQSSQLFRPPYGDLPWRFIPMLWGNQKQIIFWSIDTRDFELDNVDEIIERINFSRIKNGDIFLFHDSYQSTVDALPEIGRRLTDNAGFSMMTLSELITK